MRGRALIPVLLLVLAGPAPAADPEAPVDGRLHVAQWRFGAWGREVAGTACWLDEGDGRWRLEVAAGEPAGLDRLLDQIDDGWTVLAVDEAQVFVQPWRDKLEPLTPGEAARVRVLMRLATGETDPDSLARLGPEVRNDVPRRPSRLPWETPAATGGTLALVWTDASAPDLRAILAARARGRGGADETWRVGADPDGGLRLTSSRRAGTLRLGRSGSAPARYWPDEVYVPVWTLGEVLDPD